MFFTEKEPKCRRIGFYREWIWEPRGWLFRVDVWSHQFGLGFFCVNPRYNGVDIHFAWLCLTVQPPMMSNTDPVSSSHVAQADASSDVGPQK